MKTTTHNTNPFSTRFTRPGAIPFLFASDESLAGLIESLRQQDWRGQIIGPHGVGKSTLLRTLIPELRDMGWNVHCFVARKGQRGVPVSKATLAHRTIIVIDGFEQLGWFSRRRLLARFRRAGVGVVVTAHRNLGLPTLVLMHPTLETAGKIVQRLLPEDSTTLGPDDVREAFHATNGNLREMLFRLYDVYQRKRPGQG